MPTNHRVHVRIQSGFADSDLVIVTLNHLLHIWNLPNCAVLAVSGDRQIAATAIKMWSDRAMPITDSSVPSSDPDLVLVFMSQADSATAVVTTRQAVPHFVIRTQGDVARMSQAMSSQVAA